MTTIRPERTVDGPDIARVEFDAFCDDPHRPAGTPPTEHLIVARLRDAGALTVSLVAVTDGRIVGHVACSPVRVDGHDVGWHGLGPVAVEPARQGGGIGSALVRAAIDRLRGIGSAGVVVLGEPAFYGRFGFRADPRLTLAGVPPEYFQCLPFSGTVPGGGVTYHDAFTAS